MNFLEAHQTVANFHGGDTLSFLMAMSGTAHQFDIYLRAAAAKRGRSAQARLLPFNTLAQTLLSEPTPGETEVFLLFPWDFVPEADWRSGVPGAALKLIELRERAENVATQLERRRGARLFYVPAPMVPLFFEPADDAALAHWIVTRACSLGARLLPLEAFSLGGYLATGCPIAGAWLGKVAEEIVVHAIATFESCKVLVTDLDNTMWAGVVAEEGLDGIGFAPEGIGYRHFLYQSLLSKLRREGALLAAVSRNDPNVAISPLRSGRMLLSERDFVCVLATYHPKSSQIREIADRLNLGLESFVFVDDNPVELAEVSAQLPCIQCVPFPARDESLPAFFSTISGMFAKSAVTAEDLERTELYRRRLTGIAPSNTKGADLTAFLRGLEMKLTILDRSHSDRTRAVQLINKTNQFNLNGHRVSDDEIETAIEAGARLYGATLCDRTGSQGEIMACLLMPDGTIGSWVMSCRVFQRRVEYAFLAWLARTSRPPRNLRFTATDRNEPFREFLKDPAFHLDREDLVRFDAGRFGEVHTVDLALFRLDAPQD